MLTLPKRRSVFILLCCALWFVCVFLFFAFSAAFYTADDAARGITQHAVPEYLLAMFGFVLTPVIGLFSAYFSSPHHQRHKHKKGKNIAFLFIITALCATELLFLGIALAQTTHLRDLYQAMSLIAFFAAPVGVLILWRAALCEENK